MAPHEQRLCDEKGQLDERLQKLVAFLGGSAFQAIPTDEQLRLQRQRKIMELYQDVLCERIAAFGDKA